MEYEEPLFYRVGQYAADADRDVVDMVSGNPDWDPPAGVRDGLRAYADADPADFQYPPSEGLAELKEGIAEIRGGDPESVVVTNGAAEANYLGMAAALDRGAGDEVLLTDPVYPYYPGKVSMLGGTVRYVETAADGHLDPDAVRAAASDETACIVVNTPNNPTGAVLDAATMRELVAVAEAHDAILVSDEVYHRFDYSGRFASALAVDSPHRVVTGSFSKSFAITGYRVGYAILSKSLADAARTRHMLTNVSASRPAQRAVLRGLETVGPDYFETARETLRNRVETFTAALDEVGAEYTTPEGAFYVLVRVPDFPGTMANTERLIDEAGVAGMPGETFGEARADWLRFALVTPRVDDAAARLAAFFGDRN
ncbi:MAG: pyridoxal phosphate-dependent aminotransferase [Halobacteriaceae archaeon]